VLAEVPFLAPVATARVRRQDSDKLCGDCLRLAGKLMNLSLQLGSSGSGSSNSNGNNSSQ